MQLAQEVAARKRQEHTARQLQAKIDKETAKGGVEKPQVEQGKNDESSDSDEDQQELMEEAEEREYAARRRLQEREDIEERRKLGTLPPGLEEQVEENQRQE